MFEFDIVQCGMIVLLLMVAGEVLSHKLKAVVPSILASAVLFLLLRWCNIIPEAIIQTSALTHLTMIATMFIIIGMGLSINIRDLLANWRVVLLAAVSYTVQTCILLLVITLLFDRNTAVGGLPGGAAVALIIQERARELNLDNIVVQSALLLAIQGLVACPIASWMIRKEVFLFRNRSASEKDASSGSFFQTADSTANQPKHSPYRTLLRFYVVSWIASRLELLTGISRYVFCLLLGAILGQAGLLPKDDMDRSKSQGFLNLMMMTSIMSGFSGATPQTFLKLLLPMLCILLTDVLSILLISVLFGKLLKFSRPMSYAIGLNVMIGFPLNLALVRDIVDYLTRDSSEGNVLVQQIGSKMVIAGFTSVTFLSTVGAGLLVNLLR